VAGEARRRRYELAFISRGGAISRGGRTGCGAGLSACRKQHGIPTKKNTVKAIVYSVSPSDVTSIWEVRDPIIDVSHSLF